MIFQVEINGKIIKKACSNCKMRHHENFGNCVFLENNVHCKDYWGWVYKDPFERKY